MCSSDLSQEAHLTPSWPPKNQSNYHTCHTAAQSRPFVRPRLIVPLYLFLASQIGLDEFTHHHITALLGVCTKDDGNPGHREANAFPSRCRQYWPASPSITTGAGVRSNDSNQGTHTFIKACVRLGFRHPNERGSRSLK